VEKVLSCEVPLRKNQSRITFCQGFRIPPLVVVRHIGGRNLQ